MIHQTRLHKRGNAYYFRAKIPRDIQHLYGSKTEIKFSLGTTSIKEAKALVNQFSVKYDAEFDAKQQALKDQFAPPTVLRMVDEATARSIGRLWVRHVIDSDERIRQQMTDDEFDERETKLQADEQYMRLALARGKVEIIEHALQQFLSLSGIQLDCDQDAYRLLCRHFLQAFTEGLQYQRKRSRGEVVIGAEIAPDESVYQNVIAPSRQLTIDDLFANWRDAVPDRDTNSVAGVKACVVEFGKFMKSKSPEAYTRADFKDYKRHLEEKGNQPRTVAKKIGFLSTLISYAVEDEKLKSNPVTGLLKSAPGANRKTRLPYNSEEIKRIFASPIYTANARPTAGGGEAVVWLPLLGLMTGARLEELAQLRLEDVVSTEEFGQPRSLYKTQGDSAAC